MNNPKDECNWCTSSLRPWPEDTGSSFPKNFVKLTRGEIWVAPVPGREYLMMIEIQEVCSLNLTYGIWNSRGHYFKSHTFKYREISHWLSCYKAKRISTEKAEALRSLWQCKEQP